MQMGFRVEAQYMRWQHDIANGFAIWNPMDAPFYAMQAIGLVNRRKELDSAQQR